MFCPTSGAVTLDNTNTTFLVGRGGGKASPSGKIHISDTNFKLLSQIKGNSINK